MNFARRVGGSEAAASLLLVAVGYLVLHPFASIAWLTFAPADLPDVFGSMPWTRAFDEPGLGRSILNTALVVGATQLLSMPFAVFVAWLLGATDLPARRAFEFCFWILFFLPPLSVLTGWLLVFDPDFGLANNALKAMGLARQSSFNLYSFWGIVFIHFATHGASAKVMLLTPAFRNLDPSIEEAARMGGASRGRALLQVTLPVLAPALAMALLMSIIRGFETFEIEMVLGAPVGFQVYSNKIYQLMSGSPPEFRIAGALGLAVACVCLPLILTQRLLSTRRSYVVVGGKASAAAARLGRWRWPAFALMVLVVATMSLLPLALLVAGSFMKLFGFFDLPEVWTFEHWTGAIGDAGFSASLVNTLALGLAAASLALCVCAPAARVMARGRSFAAGPLDWLTWMPLCLPGVVIGFGYLTMTLNTPLLSPLYGGVGALVLVALVAAFPLAAQTLKAAFLQLGADLEEAGAMAGASRPTTLRRVLAPLVAPALAAAFAMVFSSTARAVSTVMLLSSGGNRVLSVLQVEFLSNGDLGAASVIGVAIVAASVAAGGAAMLAGARFGLRGR